MDEITQVRQSALGYLSRREHTRLELRQKLVAKGFTLTVIDEVLAQLQAENLLSEERFVESFVHARMSRGYGLIRIQQELRQRGVTEDLFEPILSTYQTEWLTLAAQVRQKRFGQALPTDPQQRAKQIRFLQYRGFTHAQIQSVLGIGVTRFKN